MRLLGVLGLAATTVAPLAWAQMPTGLEGLNLNNLPSFNQAATPAPAQATPKSPWRLNGFVDARAGIRTRDAVNQRNMSLGEARLQLQAERPVADGNFQTTIDIVHDPVLGDHTLNWEQGTGLVDLRELYLSQQLNDTLDVKFGRQILTWGTGDLLFINDMFPKDWNAFFIGRDEEYLKAPSDALKASYFGSLANLDVVYTPQFDNDRYIDGSRLSYSDGTGTIVGRNAITKADSRGDAFDEDEIALRLYKNINGYEAAAYAYSGYWKSPEGQTPLGQAYFPELNVYGASLRGSVANGIGNIEVGYYDSKDDSNGSNPLVRNSELRFLVGYEQELLPELTGGFQYYIEHMLNYNDYANALPAGAFKKDETRHVVTVRLTKFLMNQNLELSLFNFYSPTDQDGYTRPKAVYKIDDNWRVEGGANLFYGADSGSFFGQFSSNNNVYTAVRYSF